MIRPGTWWARRHRWQLVRPRIGAEDRVLDCGCGDGWIVGRLRAEGIRAYGVDLRGGSARGDLRALPFRAGAFDVAIALDVLEHVDCLSEIRRVLRPGGRLVMTMPTLGLERFWDILIAARLIQPRFTPHVNFCEVRDLPLRCVEARPCLMGLGQFGVLVNEPRESAA